MTTPTLIWAQRYDKVYVTFEMLKCTDVSVTFTEGLLSLKAEANGKQFSLENLPLFQVVTVEGCHWMANDRCAPLASSCYHWHACRPPCSRSC